MGTGRVRLVELGCRFFRQQAAGAGSEERLPGVLSTHARWARQLVGDSSSGPEYWMCSQNKQRLSRGAGALVGVLVSHVGAWCAMSESLLPQQVLGGGILCPSLLKGWQVRISLQRVL